MTYHIFRASLLDEGDVGISVTTEHAKSLWEFLRDQGIEVSPLSGAVVRARDFQKDRDGRLVSEEISLVQQFRAKISFEELQALADKWIPKEF
jgi:hypothetical protein